MYIQYMLCPKQEFITEPAKPKMNPMNLLKMYVLVLVVIVIIKKIVV